MVPSPVTLPPSVLGGSTQVLLAVPCGSWAEGAGSRTPSLLVSAKAAIVSTPGIAPLYEKVASPPEVVALPLVGEPSTPLAPVTAKRTVTGWTAFPYWSRTSAVTVCVSSTVLVSVAGVKVRLAGGPGSQTTVAFTPSPAVSVPFSSRSANTCMVSVPDLVSLNENAAVPPAPVVPVPLAGDGDPDPVTVNDTGMKVSFSPLRPVTWAVTVAVAATCSVCVGGLTLTVVGGEKLTRAV